MKTEVEEFNEFLGASPLRNMFLPIVHHISLLKPEQWTIDEYEDKSGKTSSVQANISHGEYKKVYIYPTKVKRSISSKSPDNKNWWYRGQ